MKQLAISDNSNNGDFEVAHIHLTESEDFVSMDSGDKTKTWNFYISDTDIIVERSDCGTVTLYESITEPQMRYVMLVLLGNNPYWFIEFIIV